jgi:4-azaleucine resistance transporter AzlC
LKQASPYVSGVLKAVPIVFGYVPIGLTFGVLAQKAGLSTFNTMAMSLLVYAGSSQLVAAGLFAAGVHPASIILTTFVVNLRHLLLSAAIAPFLKRWRKHELAAFAYQLTDETFALHAAHFPSGIPSKAEVFAINATAQMSWLAGTALGVVLVRAIADVEPFGLDYVLPAMFIALIVLQIEDRVQVGVALFSGVLSVALLILGVDQWNVIIATVISATVGVFAKELVELWTNEPSS